MSKLYREEFIDKHNNKYQIQFFGDEGIITTDKRGDLFEGTITIYQAENKKDIKIKISKTLADGNDYWEINDDKRLRKIAHEIGILDVKININNRDFDNLAGEFYYHEYNCTEKNPNLLLEKKQKELNDSFQKKIGFK